LRQSFSQVLCKPAFSHNRRQAGIVRLGENSRIASLNERANQLQIDDVLIVDRLGGHIAVENEPGDDAASIVRLKPAD
jgi:hypothetical protein